MRILVSLLLLVFLGGCTTYPVESRYAYARRVCAEAAIYPQTRAQFMRQCIATELAGGYGGYAYDAPLVAPLYQAPFGSPNSIGPYGTLGPSWPQFNAQFQPHQYGPDPLALTPLLPPGSPPVNPRYLTPY